MYVAGEDLEGKKGGKQNRIMGKRNKYRKEENRC